jgi:hypothetical protein
LVIDFKAKANVPKLKIINTDVNIIPAGESGWTSLNPTVETVIIVINKESTKLQFSITLQ